MMASTGTEQDDCNLAGCNALSTTNSHSALRQQVFNIQSHTGCLVHVEFDIAVVILGLVGSFYSTAAHVSTSGMQLSTQGEFCSSKSALTVKDLHHTACSALQALRIPMFALHALWTDYEIASTAVKWIAFISQASGQAQTVGIRPSVGSMSIDTEFESWNGELWKTSSRSAIFCCPTVASFVLDPAAFSDQQQRCSVGALVLRISSSLLRTFFITSRMNFLNFSWHQRLKGFHHSSWLRTCQESTIKIKA